MAGPTNHSAGNSKPVNSLVYDAMMSDLGVGRLEDLATDGGGRPSRHPRSPPQPSRAQRPGAQRALAIANPGLSRGWNDAITKGEFEDYDAMGVKGLDSIANGQLHRQMQTSQSNGQSNGRSNGRTGSSRRDFPSSFEQPRTSSLLATPLQGLNTNANRKSHPYDPAHPTYGNRNKPSSQSVHSSASNVRASSLGGIGPAGAPVTRWDCQPKLEQIQEAPKSTEGAKPSIHDGKKPASVSNSEGPRRVIPGGDRGEQATKNANPPKPSPLPVTQATTVSKSSTVGLLPHQRSTRPTVPTSSTKPPTSTHQTTSSALPIEARETFFQNHVTLKKRVNGSLVDLPGQVSIYELAERPVIIWELIINKEQVIRGDIRKLLAPFVNGSAVDIRRQDKPGSEVHSGQVRFNDISIAQEFEKVVKHQRKQQAGSLQPIFEQALEKNAPIDAKLAVSEKNTTQMELSEKPAQRVVDAAPVESTQPQNVNVAAPQSVDQCGSVRAHVDEPTSMKSEYGDLLIDFAEDTSAPNTSDGSVAVGALVGFSNSPKPEMIGNSYLDELKEMDQILSSYVLEENLVLPKTLGPVIPDVTPIIQDRTNQVGTPISAHAEGSSQKELATISPLDGVGASNLSPPAERNLPSKQLDIDKEIETSFLGLKAADPDPFAKNMSQAALGFLYKLSAEEYEEMIQATPRIVRLLNRGNYSHQGQGNPVDFGSFQVAWMYLGRFGEYNRLGREDKDMVLRVVHATVLHGHNRIVRPEKSILNLRSSQQPCPDEIQELNMLVRNGNRPESSRSNMFGGSTRATPPAPSLAYSYDNIRILAERQAIFLHDDQSHQASAEPLSGWDSFDRTQIENQALPNIPPERTQGLSSGHQSKSDLSLGTNEMKAELGTASLLPQPEVPQVRVDPVSDRNLTSQTDAASTASPLPSWNVNIRYEPRQSRNLSASRWAPQSSQLQSLNQAPPGPSVAPSERGGGRGDVRPPPSA